MIPIFSSRCLQIPLLVASTLIGCALAGCDRPPSGGAASQPTFEGANLVIVTIDTLRADHLGCYGYFRDTSPRIDAFATECVVFDQAVAPMATTLPSHMTLFTGLEPLEHGITANVGDGGAIFGMKAGVHPVSSLADRAGFKTAAFVSATPLKKSCGLGAAFTYYNEPESAVRRGADTIDAAITWLHANRSGRFVLFVHIYDPHYPYDPPAPHHLAYETDAQLEQWIADRRMTPLIQPGPCRNPIPTPAIASHNLYDGEVRYSDEQVGRLFDTLRELELWDASTVVFASDHGEGLNQHDWPQHGRVWFEQVHVPLMIKFPKGSSQVPRRIPLLVGLVDVMPTLIEELDLNWARDLAVAASGKNVLDAGFRERPLLSKRSDRDCPIDPGGRFALTTSAWRFHLGAEAGDLLFDRRSDPFELAGVQILKPNIAGDLLRQTRALIEFYEARGRDLDSGPPRPIEKMDPKLVRELESLGYGGESVR